MKLSEMRTSVDDKKLELSVARRAIREERSQLSRLRRELDVAEQSQQILQTIAATVQEKVHQRVAAIVTRCLEAIWGEDSYEFEIRFERKRGRTEACLVFLRDGHVLHDPLDMAGGGPCSVAAFALRVACLVLTQPSRRRLLLLDEPFLALRADMAERVRAMLESLAKELDMQVVMITHSPVLVAGKVIDLEDET